MLTKFLFHCWLISLILLSTIAVFGDPFSINSNYEVCFTPNQNCIGEIINEINHATESIEVQAFSFTSRPLAQALVRAKKRGVDVSVILDKSNLIEKKHKQFIIPYLLYYNIPIWIDNNANIAHNKVIIIDKKTVITGSFNFTWSAQHVNAENVLIIQDENLAHQYVKNWQDRRLLSKKLEPSSPELYLQ